MPSMHCCQSTMSLCGVCTQCEADSQQGLGCRYLEKVVPSPYGPRLPWHFPLSRSFWLSGDVTGGPVAVLRLKRLFVTALHKLRDPRHQPYEQVRDPLCHAQLLLVILIQYLRLALAKE